MIGLIEGTLPEVKGSLCEKNKKIGEKLFSGTRKKDSKYYSVSFTKNDAIRIRDFMYHMDDSELKLKRKYNFLCDIGKIEILKNGFLKYSEAKEFVKDLKIRSKTEWGTYCKNGNRPYNVPSTPNRTYKSKGWVSWKKWLGYKKERTKGQ